MNHLVEKRITLAMCITLLSILIGVLMPIGTDLQATEHTDSKEASNRAPMIWLRLVF